MIILSSNNTNKLSPQERSLSSIISFMGSNNTNKLSPQELIPIPWLATVGSNNTNKLSPQELRPRISQRMLVQIIQINLALKNRGSADGSSAPFK